MDATPVAETPGTRVGSSSPCECSTTTGTRLGTSRRPGRAVSEALLSTAGGLHREAIPLRCSFCCLAGSSLRRWLAQREGPHYLAFSPWCACVRFVAERAAAIWRLGLGRRIPPPGWFCVLRTETAAELSCSCVLSGVSAVWAARWRWGARGPGGTQHRSTGVVFIIIIVPSADAIAIVCSWSRVWTLFLFRTLD